MAAEFPNDVLVHHVAVLGKAGAGKTVMAKGRVEWLLKEGRRVCAIDPTGVWWGLRLKADGKTPAFPVVIFGGQHADVELDSWKGAQLAEIIATQSFSCIIDTQLMKVDERIRFFTDFAEALMRFNRRALHLIIDEAHLFAPQQKLPTKASARMTMAANNLVSGGRALGLRIMMLSQRAAKLHKDSLTQSETLVAMRLIAPQDVNAVKDWVKEWASLKQGEEVVSSLPSLKTGEGWVWAPEHGILTRMKFPMVKTFDSSRAPDNDTPLEAVTLAEIDLASIRAALAPKTLPATEKRQAAASLPKSPVAPAKPDPHALKAADASGYQRGLERGFQAGAAEVRKTVVAPLLADLKAALRLIEPLMPFAAKVRERLSLPEPIIAPVDQRIERPVPVREVAGSIPAGRTNGHEVMIGDRKLGKAERMILTALAQHGPASKGRVAILTQYSGGGGAFNNALGALRTLGLISRGEPIAITPEGEEALGQWEPLPTGRALFDWWMQSPSLGKAERAILSAIVDAGRELSKEEVGEMAQYEPSGGSFNNALGRLRTLGLIVGYRSIEAAQELIA